MVKQRPTGCAEAWMLKQVQHDGSWEESVHPEEIASACAPHTLAPHRRHPELISRSIVKQRRTGGAEAWMLKQVQHDGFRGYLDGTCKVEHWNDLTDFMKS
jgi:hypothetical protein